MSQTYFLVQKGMVVDAVVWNGDLSAWNPPAGMIAVARPDNSIAGIGWAYSNGVFTPPASIGQETR